MTPVVDPATATLVPGRRARLLDHFSSPAGLDLRIFPTRNRVPFEWIDIGLFAAECGHGVSPLTRPRARCTLGLAEGVGFEPTERSLNAQRFSRPTGVLPLTCLLATVWTGQGTARAPAAGPARRTRRPRHPQLEKNARKNTRCGGYGSELRFLGPRDGP